MKMHETLHNCLMAVANRYPDYIVEVDENIWGNQHVKLRAQTPLELLEQLQASAPELLQAPAVVECDAYKCELCVIELSQEKPAFQFHFPPVLATHP